MSGKERIGVAWDYPGQYSSLNWQPRKGEAEHPKLTLTIYDETSSHFLNCYKIFCESKTVAQFRDTCERTGYHLKTKLYNIYEKL